MKSLSSWGVISLLGGWNNVVNAAQIVLSPDAVSSQSRPDLHPLTQQNFTFSFPDCEAGPLKDNGVCNPSLHYAERVSALIAVMTLEELINSTHSTGPGVPRLGIPEYEVWSEGLHGLDRANFALEGGEWAWATSFPMPITTMAGLNRTLIHQIADIIGTQARAFNNVGRFGLNAYAPNINGFRSPLWGRGQETPGEDAAFLSAAYAYEYITGLQGGLDPDHIKITATAKHFAGYDIEDWGGHGRSGFDAIITAQDLAEYYTPQFLAASRYAKVRSFMCTYNAVNGVPTCASSFLFQTLLRDSWDFPTHGYVSSDCDAVWNIFDPHGYAGNESAAAADALRAGTDVDCGDNFPWRLNEAFAEGMVTRGEIERAVTRFYSQLVQVGYFDGNQSAYRQLKWSDVETTDSWNISYEAAVEGIVLLKNENSFLPLSNNIRSLALIGPWANATTQMQGNYYGTPPYLISPVDGAADAGYIVHYAEGTAISGNTTDGFAEALSAAQTSDAIIFLGGIDGTIEGENMDRMDLTWPGNQLDLIQQLSQTGKPLVVLQMGGGHVDSSSLKNNPNVNALLWGGYPGQSGGKAIFDILTGNRAPAGRLVTTQYPAEYAYEFPAIDMNLRPNTSSSNPGQTYMWYTGEPVYEFGHGQFYTTWEESAAQGSSSVSVDVSQIFAATRPEGVAYTELVPFMNFTATIKNTGETASPYTAMLFANTTNAGPAPYPNKWLVGFDRLATIEPGQSAELVIPVPIGTMARVDENGNKMLYPGDYQLALNLERSVVVDVKLTGRPVTVENWPVAE